MADPHVTPRWRRHPRILGLGGLAAAALAAGLVIWTTGASGAGGFRMAVAGPATVRQTLDLTGTADPVNQATAAFQVSGTVATVDVTLGQAVTAGQALASLDTATLTQDVSAASSTMTADEAKLSEDENAQSTTTTSAAASSPSSGSGGSGSTNLGAAQQKVVGAQQVADTDEQTAAAALAQAQTTCGGSSGSGGPSGGSGTGPGGGGSGGGTTTTTTTTTTPTSTTTTTTPSGTGTGSCTAALSAALSAQKQVATDQKGVATAESALAQVLSASTSSASDSSSSATGSSATGSNGSSGSGGNGSSKVGNGGSATDTPAQLASDQAAIDSAYASLYNAEQSLAAAQLVSPIAGTVASVGLTVGQSVQAGSSTDAIAVINGGTFEVVGSLTGAQSAEVKDGDTAAVSVDGTTGTEKGTVVRVGPVDTSGSSDTYPVVVTLSPGSHGIAAGSSAEVSIVLRQVADTLAVPTSAVNTVGTRGTYVFVVRDGSEVRQRVTVGVVGAVYTQILSGISDGTPVVLADLSEAVPASSSTTTGRFGTFGAGLGLGGGGFGGGGFGGGGFSRVSVNAG